MLEPALSGQRPRREEEESSGPYRKGALLTRSLGWCIMSPSHLDGALPESSFRSERRLLCSEGRAWPTRTGIGDGDESIRNPTKDLAEWPVSRPLPGSQDSFSGGENK